MSWLLRLLAVLGINAVPAGGVLVGGWSWATALVLYWAENLVGSILIAIRIALHRKLTRKRGHWRAQLGVRVGTSGSRRGKGDTRREDEGRPINDFFKEFLAGGLVFTLAHGVLLAIVIGIFAPETDLRPLRVALPVMAALQLVGFAADLIGLRDRPFAWIRRVAQQHVGRVVLVHLALVVGGALAMIGNVANGFFLVFAALKAVTDLASAVPRRADRDPDELPEKPPRWLAAVSKRVKPGEDLDSWWAAERERKRREAEEDERTVEVGRAGAGQEGRRKKGARG